MTLLADIQYFPSINLYKNIGKSSNIVFEQYESYQKTGFRNRCRIAGAEGMVELSIPLTGGRDQKALVRDVRISDRLPWAAQHWKTIVSCYSRSPWFDHYREGLGALYRKKWTFLLDWDLAGFDWTLRALRLERHVTLTSEWRRDYGADTLDCRGIHRGEEEQDADVRRYRQVFEERTGFIAGLSILDLLFCEGGNAIRYIRSS